MINLTQSTAGSLLVKLLKSFKTLKTKISHFKLILTLNPINRNELIQATG